MPRVGMRWKGKDGEFLPEVGREDERDMRVEVVHYSDLERVALEACTVEDDPESYVGFSITGKDVAIVSTDVYQHVNPFSVALEMARIGMAIQRAGWNGKGLMVRAQFPDELSKMSLPYLYLEYPDGQRCPWTPSQTDVMATDWRAL